MSNLLFPFRSSFFHGYLAHKSAPLREEPKALQAGDWSSRIARKNVNVAVCLAVFAPPVTPRVTPCFHVRAAAVTFTAELKATYR